MIELEVIKGIRGLNPKVPCIAGRQNGVHPNTVFIIVEEVSSGNAGTKSKELTSRTGKWKTYQSREYDIRIGVQGTFDSQAADMAEMLLLRMDHEDVRAEFMDLGYTYVLGTSILPLPMMRDTAQYIRYSFTVKLRTSISMDVEYTPMEQAEVEGSIVVEGVTDEYTEVIPKG